MPIQVTPADGTAAPPGTVRSNVKMLPPPTMSCAVVDAQRPLGLDERHDIAPDLVGELLCIGVGRRGGPGAQLVLRDETNFDRHSQSIGMFSRPVSRAPEPD